MLKETLEDFVSLQLPEVQINTDSLQWHRYNPRKEISRWGASITSLDGQGSGVPDLDSLYEYNRLNGTSHKEADFTQLTEAGQPFSFLQEQFDMGRSHFIKLGSGGFFPYHRDLGMDVFRLVYCVKACYHSNFVWIQNDRVLKLRDGGWYYMNTKHPHATFAFNECIFAVFNMINTEKSWRGLLRSLEIK